MKKINSRKNILTNVSFCRSLRWEKLKAINRLNCRAKKICLTSLTAVASWMEQYPFVGLPGNWF